MALLSSLTMRQNERAGPLFHALTSHWMQAAEESRPDIRWGGNLRLKVIPGEQLRWELQWPTLPTAGGMSTSVLNGDLGSPPAATVGTNPAALGSPSTGSPSVPGGPVWKSKPSRERDDIDPNQTATRNCSGSAVSSKREKYRDQDLVTDKKRRQRLPSWMDSGETEQATGWATKAETSTDTGQGPCESRYCRHTPALHVVSGLV